MRRTARQFFPNFHSKSLPLSTLLLAALCMALAAPASHASSRGYSSHAAILSVLQRGELSASVLQDVLAPRVAATSQLSLLEVRQLHALLSTLDAAQLLEIGQHLATLELGSNPRQPLLSHRLVVTPAPYSSLPSHLAAQLCGVRTNAYLE
jgi:hypothetical protein